MDLPDTQSICTITLTVAYWIASNSTGDRV